ncbi:hypothetical protein [Azospirillum baldaniorum]|uniref:hypothetical protein n=1 Tax=Azospirillum baldaniorum TaxID=1064539 RepID=UPI001180DCCD|nr:hypothetical protein [Azospirillum baldaniorum]
MQVGQRRAHLVRDAARHAGNLLDQPGHAVERAVDLATEAGEFVVRPGDGDAAVAVARRVGGQRHGDGRHPAQRAGAETEAEGHAGQQEHQHAAARRQRHGAELVEHGLEVVGVDVAPAVAQPHHHPAHLPAVAALVDAAGFAGGRTAAGDDGEQAPGHRLVAVEHMAVAVDHHAPPRALRREALAAAQLRDQGGGVAEAAVQALRFLVALQQVDDMLVDQLHQQGAAPQHGGAGHHQKDRADGHGLAKAARVEMAADPPDPGRPGPGRASPGHSRWPARSSEAAGRIPCRSSPAA